MIPFLFTLSGAAALAYEVAWTRLLALLLGSSIHSVSLVLGTFMVGFALGGALGGRIADRVRRPLLAFSALQVFLGFFALGFPHLLRAIDLLAGDVGRRTFGTDPILFTATFAAVLLPTTAMGATFPLVVRSFVSMPGRIGSGSGFLFGCNLLGAAAGAGLAGFVGVRELGIEGTIGVAACVNGIVAVGAWFTARSLATRSADPSGDPPPFEPSSRRERASVLVLYAVAGFSAIGVQVVWTRILTFFLEGFTYTFTAIVVVYLLGMFAGSWAVGAWVRRRTPGPGGLAALVACWSLAALGGLVLLERVPDGVESLRVAFSPHPGTLGFAAGLASAAFLFLFLPTFCFGGMLPVAARLYVGGAVGLGRDLGHLYAINNLGAAVGAIAAGYGVLGAFGTKGALAVYCGAGILASSAAILAGGPGNRTARRWMLAAAVALAGAGGIAAIRPERPIILSSHVFRGSRGPEHVLVESREGAGGAVSVVDNLRTGQRFLYTDDFLAAGTGRDYAYMRLLGHLPALLAERRDTALVIGFGSGTTAGALAAHPFRTIRIVEIVPEVLEVADRFRDVNGGVLADPRTTTEVGDGRHALAAGHERYDVLTLEPLMPYTPGAVSLYTREFYRLGLERLKPGGWFCQWVPVHALPNDLFRVLLRTFVDVFPFSSVWFYERSVILVGGRRELRISYEEFRARAEEEGVARDLARSDLHEPDAVLGGFVSGGRPLREWMGDGAVLTDDRPVTEFHPLPRSFVTTFAADNLADLRRAVRFPGSAFDFTGLSEEASIEAIERLRSWVRSSADLMSGMAARSLRDYLAVTGRGEESIEPLALALRDFASALEAQPRNAVAEWHLRDTRFLFFLAEARRSLGEGDLPRAQAAAARAAELLPDRPEAYALLGRAALAAGRPSEAADQFAAALARFPLHGESLWYLAWLRYAEGNREAARRYLQQAREVEAPSPLPEGDRARMVRDLGGS